MARPDPDDVLARIEAGGVAPIFTADDPMTARQVAACVMEGGLGVLEFTSRSAAALGVFGDLVAWARAESPSLEVGIGTVTDADAAHRAVDLGARFVVGPCLVEEVAAACAERRVPSVEAGPPGGRRRPSRRGFGRSGDAQPPAEPAGRRPGGGGG